MSGITLLVFEGQKTEPQIFNNLEKTFFADQTEIILQATYNTVIYRLWKQLAEDEDLDLIEVLKEISPENAKSLGDVERDEIDQIYLFFDYDGHASNAADDKLEEMLQHFDQETENGKLYVSYPMVESLKDLNDDTDFQHHFVAAKQNINYKKLVSDTSKYKHLNEINRQSWHQIIFANVCKANLIVADEYLKPDVLPSQDLIFDKQLSKYIKPDEKVAVLSAFPFFISEYFGVRFYKSINPH